MAWGVVLNSIWATSSCSHCSHRHRVGKGQRTSKPWPSETRSSPVISTPGGRSTSMVTLAMAPPGSMPLRDAGSRRSRLQGTDGQDDKPKDWLRQKGEKYRGLALYSGRTVLQAGLPASGLPGGELRHGAAALPGACGGDRGAERGRDPPGLQCGLPAATRSEPHAAKSTCGIATLGIPVSDAASRG